MSIVPREKLALNYLLGGFLLGRAPDFPKTDCGSIDTAASWKQRGSPSHDAVRLGVVVFSGRCWTAEHFPSSGGAMRRVPAVLRPC